MARRKGLGRSTAAYLRFADNCLKALEMASQGMSYQQIADRQGVHKSTAYRRVWAALEAARGDRK